MYSKPQDVVAECGFKPQYLVAQKKLKKLEKRY